MKIRTRLLLFLLPTLVGSIALFSTLIAWRWHHDLKEIVEVQSVEIKFQATLFLILLSAAFTIFVMVGALYFIAKKISDPVQKLNNSALALAAGQYNQSIYIEGPKEIAELANTLNTMGECLNENINRLKENSHRREQMYGEYECAILLQHLMLQKNIDDCRSDAVSVKAITFFSETPRGLLLDFPKSEKPDLFLIHMAETEEPGLEGTYQLLTRYKFSKESQTHTSVILDRKGSVLQWKGASPPFVWSLDEKRFVGEEGTASVQSGDYFFLFNQGLKLLYQNNEAKVSELIAKVLKVFAADGLETIQKMLLKELAFITKRKPPEEDIHLLCFQVLG